MDFLNIQLPPEDENKYPKLDAWFDFMNGQLEKIQDIQQTGKINSVLTDNDIETIKYKS